MTRDKKFQMRVNQDFFNVLDELRGEDTYAQYIRKLVFSASKKPEIKNTPLGDKYKEARDFCQKVKSITYDIDYEMRQGLENEAKEIAERNGLVLVGKWFTDPEIVVDGHNKFVCKWE